MLTDFIAVSKYHSEYNIYLSTTSQENWRVGQKDKLRRLPELSREIEDSGWKGGRISETHTHNNSVIRLCI